MSEKSPVNMHATGVVVAGAGVIISGASGSGKSSLAFELLEQAGATGRSCSLVADDQIFLSGHTGGLVMLAPAPIAGLAEMRGFGIAPIDHEPSAVVDLMVELVPASEAPRYRRDKVRTLEGVAIPCLELAERESAGSARAIFAWIDNPDSR